MDQERNKRKVLEGIVLSSKMDKTAIVCVERKVRHKRYGKVIKLRSKFYAHDPSDVCGEGDVVRISETRPLSKTKRWRVLEVLKKAVI